MSGSGEDKKERLAKALRENLHKRKSQSRARTGSGTAGHRERPIKPASTRVQDGQSED
ncbi:MAG: hypothetical protein VXX00_07380 [Pseudomonadota bacterium]|nr:hypothetical protein [Pseudomonadota bacterium]